MIDKRKVANKNTTGSGVRKENTMATTKVRPLTVTSAHEDQLTEIAFKVAHDPSVIEDVKSSIDDSKNGRLISIKDLEKEIERRLKK